MFTLTGSYQAQIHSAISQSLARKTSILRLLLFILQEMRESKITDSLEEIILKGGYETLSLSNAYSSYFQAYVE